MAKLKSFTELGAYAQWKPDRLNGKTILRPVVQDGGVAKIDSTFIAHPPSVAVDYPVLPLEELVEMAVKDLTGPTGTQAMKVSDLRRKLASWMSRVAFNERKALLGKGT